MYQRFQFINHKLLIVLGLMLTLLLGQSLASFTSGDIGGLVPSQKDTWTSNASYATAPTTGTGLTAESPYILSTPAHLAYISRNAATMSQKYLALGANLDMGAHVWTPISVSEISLDGNGYTISNLKTTDATVDNVGLFGDVTTLKVSNLQLANVSFVGKHHVGAVAGSVGNVTVTNVSVSGSVRGIGSYVGGIVGRVQSSASASNFTYNFNTADVTSVTGAAGGILGYGVFTIFQNCINYGTVAGADKVGGIAGYYAATINNCLAECTIKGDSSLGGLVGGMGLTISNSGFRGKIISDNSSVSRVGTIAGFYENAAGLKTNIQNCFGIAEIDMPKTSSTSAVNVFGADVSLSNFTSTYSYTSVLTSTDVKEYRKYKLSASESESTAFTGWACSPYINGGFPFPTGLFAVGNFVPSSSILTYLLSFDFNSRLPLEIKSLANSTYGTDKYVELGKYPQTYVGSSMNTTLENWYSGKTVVDTYTVDNGTSATPNVYNAYTYTNGKTYVRVPTPSVFSTSAGTTQSVYSDGTVASTSATWFEVEPIRWLILNYADVQNGASPVVVAEKALTAKVTWNKAQADENLWSGTSNIRTWLNGTFYNDTFGSDEKGNIVNTTVLNNSQSSDTDGTGTSTTDNVWLLSNNEAFGKYFTTNAQRIASPTDFAIANNCYLYTNSSYPTTARPNGGTCFFWLRSAYPSYTNSARVVNYSGALLSSVVGNTLIAVRPALTLNLES